MIALGLDTSTPAVSVALAEVTADRVDVLAAGVVVDARRHGELLAGEIASALASAGVPAAAVGAVVVGLGPGPYTGLRVGVATAAAFADALGVAVYGVCSLDALAHEARLVQAPDAGPHTAIAVAVDARRKELYWARYDAAGTRVVGPAVSRSAELVAHLGPDDLLAGEGFALYPDAVSGHRLLAHPRHPGAGALLALAAARIRASAPADALAPLYLRRPDAVPPAAVTGACREGASRPTAAGEGGRR